MPVHVVPARVKDHAVTRNARMPFVCFMWTHHPDIAAVCAHVVNGVSWTVPAATQVPAATLGNEHYTPIRKRTRIKVIERAVSKLL